MPPTHRDLIYDWNRNIPPQSKLLHRIEFDDETLRDGLQSPSVLQPSIDDRLAILRSMVPLGIHAADIGLPGSGVNHYQAGLALARCIVEERLPIGANCACRTLPADIEAVARLQQEAGLQLEAAMFLGASRLRMLVQQWDEAFLVRSTVDSVRLAKQLGLRVMFVTEDTTRMHPDLILAIYKAAIEEGAERICLSDTVGHTDPQGVTALVHFVDSYAVVGDVKIDWHGHNDRGLAVANALAAVQAGAHRIHGTALGIGERVGNCSMDQLLVNLRLQGIISNDLTSLPDYVQLAADALGMPIPVNYPMLGKDAFRTATGVHASAVLKAGKMGDPWLEDAIYSGVPAAWLGRKQEICIGTLSGRSNAVGVLEVLGLPADDASVDKLFAHGKAGARVLELPEIYEILGIPMPEELK